MKKSKTWLVWVVLLGMLLCADLVGVALCTDLVGVVADGDDTTMVLFRGRENKTIARLDADLHFMARGLAPGWYHVEVMSSKRIYETLTVHVDPRLKIGFSAQYKHRKEKVPTAQGMLHVPPGRAYDGIVPRHTFSLWSLLMNPMILMMAMPLLLIAMMKWMPEEMEELQKKIDIPNDIHVEEMINKFSKINKIK